MVVPARPTPGDAGLPGVTPRIPVGGTLTSSPKPTVVYDPRQQAIQATRAARDPQAARPTSNSAELRASTQVAARAAAAKPAAGAPKGAAAAAPGVAASSAVVRDRPRAPFSNPNLHPLAESTFTDGMNAKIQRGVMVRLDEVAGDANTRIPAAQRYQFRFLYNPESLAVSTNVFQGVVEPGFGPTNDPFAAKFVGQESMSFGLMVDRTQEVYEQGPVRTRGTLPDIEALYKVVNGSIGINAGFLYLSSVEVHWSRTATNSVPKFMGYVTSINVTHTKFTPYMTPIRSLIDISMARISTTGGANAIRSDAKGLA